MRRGRLNGRLIGLVVGLAAGLMGWAQDSATAESAFQQGILQYTLGEYAGARAYFTDAIKHSGGDYVRAYTMRGATYLMTGQYDSAVRDLRTAWRKDPTEYNALRFLIETYWARRQFDSALAVAERLHRVVPDPIYYDHFILARLYYYNDRPSEGFRKYREMIARYDTALTPRSIVASEYLSRGRPDSAMPLIRYILAREPLHEAALFNKGVAYAQKKLYDSAVTAFLTYLLYYPGRADAYLYLADAYRFQQKWDRAKKYYHTAIAADPSLDLSYFSLAYIYEQEQKVDSAVMTMVDLLAQYPDHPQGTYWMGRLLALEGRDEACFYLKRAAGLGVEEARRVVDKICRFQPEETPKKKTK